MRRIIILCLAAALIWAACEDKAIEGGGAEVWKGELAVQRYTPANPWLVPDTDQVTLTVEGGLYSLQHTVNESRICDSRGQVRNFGKNLTTFEVENVQYDGECDTVRIPQGEFESVFRGDSLYLGPKKVTFGPNDTLIYHFMLRLSR